MLSRAYLDGYWCGNDPITRLERGGVIEFRMLGTLDLRAGDGRDVQSVLRHPKRLALLAYLAAARPRGYQRRDALVALFWPDLDQSHARNALRQAVHFLRDALGHEVLVARGEEELALDPLRLSCDIAQFEKRLDAGEHESALAIYRGDLLAAFHISDAPEFERWLDLERERLRARAVGSALALAQQAEMSGELLRAARWASSALEISPYDETALRRLLHLLDQGGDRADAIHAYEAFASRLAADLSLEPAPETMSLANAIRRRIEPRQWPATPEAAPARSAQGQETPSVSGSTARRKWLFALGALLLVSGGATVIARRSTTHSLDPTLLAIAPFDALDPRLELWREGLVDVLARSLDGAGPFRTVSPTVVIRRWDGRADRASAKDLGKRTSAGFVVFGQLLRAGPDSVRMIGAVLDARAGRTLIEIDRRDQDAHMDRLADSVSVDVIRALMPTTAHIRLYSVGTHSLPALKAFLQGEHFLRRFVLDSAIASYNRAVAMDTRFALALRRLQLAIGWNDSGGPIDYFAQAAVLNHGLSPRDSLLVLSDSGLGGRGLVADHPAFHSIMRRRFAALEEAIRRYPEDPEVWYQLGEARFHRGFVVGSSWNEAKVAFDHAIALDPGFAPAYIHPVEIALSDNDPETARRYVRGYLAISSVIPGGAAMRLLSELLEPDGRGLQVLNRDLDTASFNTLHLLGLAVRLWPDVNETQVKIWPRLVATARARLAAGDSGVYRWPSVLESAYPSVLIHRGHLREAGRAAGNRVSASFMELARLGAVPPETAEQALDSWLRHPSPEDVSFYSRMAALPCSRTMDAALWWASRQDADHLRRLSDREGRLSVNTATGRPVLGFVLGALALAEGDTTQALNRFLAFPDSLCRDAWQLREARFRLLSATGRLSEAAAVFDRANDRWLPLVLERARVAERLDDRPTAIKWYRFVADAWRHADPELQPVVAAARTALRRLGP